MTTRAPLRPLTIVAVRDVMVGMVRAKMIREGLQHLEITGITKTQGETVLHYNNGQSSEPLGDRAMVTVVAEGFEF